MLRQIGSLIRRYRLILYECKPKYMVIKCIFSWVKLQHTRSWYNIKEKFEKRTVSIYYGRCYNTDFFFLLLYSTWALLATIQPMCGSKHFDLLKMEIFCLAFKITLILINCHQNNKMLFSIHSVILEFYD